MGLFYILSDRLIYWRIGHQKIILFQKIEHGLYKFGGLWSMALFELTEKGVSSSQYFTHIMGELSVRFLKRTSHKIS